jgi:mannose-6-phosphate isomerase-like protein (cupin superfamily)
MTAHRVNPDALEPSTDYPCDRRAIATAADLDLLHLARYTLQPGESLARSYHFHEHREEAFYVLDGTLHVETPDGTVEIPADEVFVATPGDPHRAFNPASAAESVSVLGMGAPRTDPAIEYERSEN